MSDNLRIMTWLAPSVPMGLYRRIGEELSTRLGREVTVQSSVNAAGPNPGVGNPFSWGTVDIGFMTAPVHRALIAHEDAPSVQLLGVAPVFDDPRNEGKPVHFCELVVRSDDPARNLDGLKRRRFGYNDTGSLTGWLGMCTRLEALDTTPSQFFGSVQRTGSHLTSMARLMAGVIDAACMDSNSLLLARQNQAYATARLRVIESIGPWPVQPISVRADMPEAEVSAIAAALIEAGPWPEFRLRGFARQTEADLAACPLAGLGAPDSDESTSDVSGLNPIGQ